MLPIQRKISPYNHYNYNNIKYIIVHYVGANSTAKNNVDYFYGGDRQASAHYFVDDSSIWQSVEDYHGSWSIGNSVTAANNTNSLNIEMCLVDGQVTDATEENTLELVKYLMSKYNVSIDNVRTHAQVTNFSKICPNWSSNNWLRWNNFKVKLQGLPVNPSIPEQPKPSTEKRVLVLSANVESWRVYPLGVAPVIGNECGRLAPRQFGGLSYEILGNPQNDVYTIQTQSFGKVNIYAPQGDGDSYITTSAPTLTPQPKPPTTDKYLNLSPNEPSWRVYPLGVQARIGNECGKLAPARFCGLSYKILKDYGNGICEIQTQSFGRVQIVKCLGDGGTETDQPLY